MKTEVASPTPDIVSSTLEHVPDSLSESVTPGYKYDRCEQSIEERESGAYYTLQETHRHRAARDITEHHFVVDGKDGYS